jgi:hypothetical protein
MMREICKGLVDNYKRDDDDRKYVYSFIHESLVLKSYDELDDHEFILEANYNIPSLMCNICNVYGPTIATRFATYLSYYLKEDITIACNNHAYHISFAPLWAIAKKVFSDIDDHQKLMRFVTFMITLFMYECACEDYEQMITDVADFDKIIFINGIGYRKNFVNNKKVLSPINEFYNKLTTSTYYSISGILVPQCLISSVFHTDCSEYPEIIEGRFREEAFIDRFNQLSEIQLNELFPERTNFNGHLDTLVVGKWYNVTYDQSHPVGKTYYYRVENFKEDGTLSRSMLIDARPIIPSYENWSRIKFSWETRQDQLLIKNNLNDSEEVHNYKVVGSTLIVGGKVYYRSYEEAMQNCEIV